MFTTNPAYVSDWYLKLAINQTISEMPKLTIHGEVNLITGIISYIPMSLVALSSINSIANSLNWSEWRFVQTKLGVFSLCMGLTHTVSMYLNIFLKRHANDYSTPLYFLTRVKLMSGYFPAIVLFSRFLFAYFPPISKRIENIRKGIIFFERKNKLKDIIELN